MSIFLNSKPGITGASTLAIPKNWDPHWFRDFIINQLKGADVRNAVGANGVVVSGNISTPYGTIALGGTGPIVLTNNVTINPSSGNPLTVRVNGVTVFIVNGTTSPTLQGYGPVFGGLVDMTPDKGSYTGVATGFAATAPTANVVWRRSGNLVTMSIGNFTGTSNANTFTIPNTNIPASIKPTTQQSFNIPGLEDNTAFETSTNSFVQILTDGTIRFIKAGSTTGWTAAGTKGLSPVPTFTYVLA